MNGKWRAVGIATISLLVGALLTIVGYSVRGLLWERPAVEVKRVEADAATVAASAEKEKAAAEIAKSEAEKEKAKAQQMMALAEQSKADAEHEMARYHPTLDAQPELVRPAAGGYANFAFLLGVTDWALARNVRLGPWLHLQTWSHHLAAVPYGTELVVESKVHDLFERKGHEFVDLDVSAFDGDRRPVMAARMRAIYKLRR